MKWKIMEQEEKLPFGKGAILVRCKRLRYYPQENGGETTFGKIRFPLFQVVIQDETGKQLRLKCNCHGGLNAPKFVIKHPGSVDYPKIVVGEGRKRREIPDVLSPKVKVPGREEVYNTPSAFEDRLTKFAGALVTDEVMNLFANKIGAVAAVRAAA